ncbi:DUF397 domain-containing protein [Streptomyces pratens]|uniref:DUF397 domain-containing protein n=1 Tax=Streptomyces pratens TaxID=887456 RepID=A0ABW1LYV3_9ACTN
MTSEQSEGQALHWFKSSYSGGAGGDCIEVAAEWFKSSYSGGEGGECVEVASLPVSLPVSVHVRDSKDIGRGAFAVAPSAWSAFVAHARQAH